MMSQLSENQKGMIFALVGYSAFTFSDTAVKYIAPYYPPLQLVCIQTAIASLGILLSAKFLGGWTGGRNLREMKYHAIRALMNILVCILIFYSFTMLSLASIYAMIFTKPFFAAILAVIFYKERVNLPRWLAIIIGFIGVLVILQPGPDSFRPQLLVPLMAGFFLAIMFLTARSLKQASPFIICFYPILGTFILALPFAIFGTPDFHILLTTGEFNMAYSQPVQPQHIPFFMATALFATTGVLCVSLAFRVASASQVAPFMYIEMVWGLIFGFFIFSDIPDVWMLVGTVVIIASGLYLILLERSKRPAAIGPLESASAPLAVSAATPPDKAAPQETEIRD